MNDPKLARWSWLFLRLCRPPWRWLVPDRAYYWLLDLLTDNNGWRPLSIREGRR